MDNRPVIVGMDMLTPLGTQLEDQVDQAIAGKSGIGPLTRFTLPEDFPVTISGQVPDMDTSDYDFLKPREMAHWFSPVFKHALLVVHRALKQSGLEITPEISPRVATTFSTAIGGLDAVLKADRDMRDRGKLPHPFVNPNSCINMVGGKVSILSNATGPITTSITACATGSTSLITGAMFLQAGMADAAICGAVDFPLVEPIVAGFATMNGAYKNRPKQPEPPEAASRPFSCNRRGFVISEGAAAMIICTREFAKKHSLEPLATLAGWAMTSDAHHFVAPRQATVSRCMTQAIDHAGISPGDISAVNAHAASTKVGDAVEAKSLKDVFGTKLPPITANKSLIGHCMGASSAIELVLALKSMEREILPPTINLKSDKDLDLENIFDHAVEYEPSWVLKNAFGFGGCNACVVLGPVA